jgi:DNA modification methylase
MTANVIRDGASVLRLAIIYQPIDRLKPNPSNARTHSKRQIQKIAASMREFGVNCPILIDGEGNVISGHGRLLACRQLGLGEVPTISLEHLTPAQVAAFTLADNKLAQLADWDNALLGEQLRLLSEMNLDFSLELTGFEIPEIDALIEEPEGTDRADEVAVLVQGPVVSRPGDLWLLDRHRIHCGSALDEEAYRVLMGEDRAPVVFTDPPYNVPIEGHVSGLGKIHHREFAMASGEMDATAFTDFLTRACALLASYSRDGTFHYLCIDWRHVFELLSAGKKVYSELKNSCVWTKDNAGMGSLYRSQHELVLVFKNGRGQHRNNVQLGKHGRHRSNVWNYPCARSFSRSSEEGNLLALHPTVKPVRLVADALLDCTARGEIVLDGFLGSGTTLIAAERVGRTCYALEIEPLYVDTAIRRWQADTGSRAIHAETGHTFEETRHMPVEPASRGGALDRVTVVLPK